MILSTQDTFIVVSQGFIQTKIKIWGLQVWRGRKHGTKYAWECWCSHFYFWLWDALGLSSRITFVRNTRKIRLHMLVGQNLQVLVIMDTKGAASVKILEWIRREKTGWSEKHILHDLETVGLSFLELKMTRCRRLEPAILQDDCDEVCFHIFKLYVLWRIFIQSSHWQWCWDYSLFISYDMAL